MTLCPTSSELVQKADVLEKIIYFPKDEQVFLRLGRVTLHPQFNHLNFPPAPYRFVSDRQLLPGFQKPKPHFLKCVGEFISQSLKANVPLITILDFVRRRGPFRPQINAVELLPSFPLTLGRNPWLIEIEDSTTLFFPFMRNGNTKEIDPRSQPWMELARRSLANPQCKGVLSHMESTVSGLKTFFADSPAIHKKLFHVPTPYIPDHPFNFSDKTFDFREVKFFFNNSWSQDRINFSLRGGLLVLEAFTKMLDDGVTNFKLVIRSRMPRDLRHKYKRLFDSGRVEVIDYFIPKDEFQKMLAQSHVYLLPAARLHVHSLLEAAYFGNAVLTSDGWGIDEYTIPHETTFVLPGIYNSVSWMDKKLGLLREDYQPMLYPSQKLVSDFTSIVRSLLKSPDQIISRAKKGHELVTTKFSLAKTNAVLKSVLGTALDGDLSLAQNKVLRRTPAKVPGGDHVHGQG